MNQEKNNLATALAVVLSLVLLITLLILSNVSRAKKENDLRQSISQNAYERGAIDQYLGKIEVKPVLFDANGKTVKYEVKKIGDDH